MDAKGCCGVIEAEFEPKIGLWAGFAPWDRKETEFGATADARKMGEGVTFGFG